MRTTDFDKLRAVGDRYLRSAADQLNIRGTMTPVIILLDPVDGGADEIVVFDPQFLADDASKDELVAKIRARVAKGGFTSVAMMADASRLRGRTPQEGELIVKLRMMGLSNKDINDRFKIGVFADTVIFTVDTIDCRGFAMDMDYRETDGKFEFDQPEFREITPSKHSRMRFFECE